MQLRSCADCASYKWVGSHWVRGIDDGGMSSGRGLEVPDYKCSRGTDREKCPFLKRERERWRRADEREMRAEEKERTARLRHLEWDRLKDAAFKEADVAITGAAAMARDDACRHDRECTRKRIDLDAARRGMEMALKLAVEPQRSVLVSAKAVIDGLLADAIEECCLAEAEVERRDADVDKADKALEAFRRRWVAEHPKAAFVRTGSLGGTAKTEESGGEPER